jgi:hypothetical protein
MEVAAMVTLQSIKEQMFNLLEQLSHAEQQEVLQYLSQKLNSQPVDSFSDPDDTPNEIVIEGIKEGLKEAITGKTIPLSQMWEGINVE